MKQTAIDCEDEIEFSSNDVSGKGLCNLCKNENCPITIVKVNLSGVVGEKVYEEEDRIGIYFDVVKCAYFEDIREG